MTLFKAIVTAAVISSIAAPALAWGQREQDFLKGVAATVVIGSITKNRAEPRHYEPRYVPQQQSYHRVSDRQARNAFYDFSDRARYAIQDALAQNGYYRGRIDGSWGPSTWNALQDFAADQGRYRALSSYNGTISVLEDLML